MAAPEISYRTFRNTDPPQIVELWNRSIASRGMGRIPRCDVLETLLFSKPFFDPQGLHLALSANRIVGMCHAGFGCTPDESALDYSNGVIACLLVESTHRLLGVGSALVRQARQYLEQRGAKTTYIGCFYPNNPFFLGVYGGCGSPGILRSSEELTAFFIHEGAELVKSCRVLQGSLVQLAGPNDSRLPLLRRQVDILVEPWPMPTSWWDACIFGPTVSLKYEMTERSSNQVIGSLWVWEMETVGNATGVPTVGISQFHISQSHQGRGFGKLLLYSVMKHLSERRIGTLEVQIPMNAEKVGSFFQSFGFKEVDVGHQYRFPSPARSS